MRPKYAVVTPVKNEERFFRKTVESVLTQTVRPERWVIINDGSTDGTGEIVDQARASWNAIVRIDTGRPSERRKPGGESLLDLGIRRLNLAEYDFFVRMDGDISFDPDYFERLFAEFEKDPSLGMASGVCYLPVRGRLEEEKHPRFHTRGPLKTYRMRCFSEIGGLETGLGWDTVDEVRANMLGWHTRSFPELRIIHYRRTQTAAGALEGNLNFGRASYYLGYHPAFLLLRAVKAMTRPPYLLGGLFMLTGYLRGYFFGERRVADREFVGYLRRQQVNRLLGRDSIWK